MYLTTPGLTRQACSCREAEPLRLALTAARVTRTALLASGFPASTRRCSPEYARIYNHAFLIAVAEHLFRCGRADAEIARQLSVPVPAVQVWRSNLEAGPPHFLTSIFADDLELRVATTGWRGLHIPHASAATERALARYNYADEPYEVWDLIRLRSDEFQFGSQHMTGFLGRLYGRPLDDMVSAAEALPMDIVEWHRKGAVIGADGAHFGGLIDSSRPDRYRRGFGFGTGLVDEVTQLGVATESAEVVEHYLQALFTSKRGRGGLELIAFDGAKAYLAEPIRLLCDVHGLGYYKVRIPVENPMERLWVHVRRGVGPTVGMTLEDLERAFMRWLAGERAAAARRLLRPRMRI